MISLSEVEGSNDCFHTEQQSIIQQEKIFEAFGKALGDTFDDFVLTALNTDGSLLIADNVTNEYLVDALEATLEALKGGA